jgi:hypothetical protein
VFRQPDTVKESKHIRLVVAKLAFGQVDDLKSTGSNLGCPLRCGFSCQSFSQSASDGTVTSACFA